MAITANDKKISQMTDVAASVGMYVPLIDLTQPPSAQNVRATVTSILSLVPAPSFASITGKPTTLSGYGITDAVSSTGTTVYGLGFLSLADASSAQTYIGASGSGTVTSVGLVGTANQITVSGASPITTSGSFTLSFPAGGVTLPGTTTGTFSGALTGNASTATALQTARTINGTSFDGTANITVSAAAGTLTGATLAAGVTASSLLSAAGGSFGTAAFTAASAYQPIDADLTAIAALTTTAYGRDFLVQVDAAAARTYIGAGTGSGTVTSFSSGNLSPLFTTSVATATTTPALSFTLSAQSANLVFSGPTSGGAAAPTFRGLVAADVPTLNQNTTGSAATLATPRAIYGNNFDGSAALTQIIASTFGGTGNGFTAFTGPETSEKTFTLPNASATILTTNAAVTVAQGGTGSTTLTGLLQGNGTSAFTAITDSSTVGQVLRVTGASTYAWGALDLADTDAVTGTLASARGGTGQTTYASGDLLYGNGGGTLSKLAEPGLPGYVLSWAANIPVATQLSTIAVTALAGTANEITASAATGSVTLSLPSALTFTGKTVTDGTFNSGAFNGTLGATTPNTVLATSFGFSGNITASSTGQRFIADLSNATIANRFIFQSSTTNGNSNVVSAPNGTATLSSFTAANASDPTNAAKFQIYTGTTQMNLNSGKFGSGTTLPIVVSIDDVEVGRFTSSGFQGAIGATTPAAITGTTIISTVMMRLKNYTVAGLPAGTQGDMAYCTDLLAPAFLVAAAGGGSVVGPVFYNGAAWVSC